MSRMALTALLVAVLLTGAAGGAGAHPAGSPRSGRPAVPVVPNRVLEVTGVLQYRQESPARFEVNGYVLIGLETNDVAQLLGRTVVVRGTLVNGPNIYMRRVIQVQEIAPDTVVGIPADPPRRLVFGRVERDCDQFYLVQQESGPRPLLNGMDLSHLVGSPVAVAAEEEITSEGVTVYHVYQAIPLAEDQTPYLGTIYQLPDLPIQVRMNGQPVPMDRAPIMANDRVLVALRPIAEAMGAQVMWNEAMHQVTVLRGNRSVVLRIGSPQVQTWEAGQEPQYFTTDITPVLLGGRTMVPIRVLADGLGLKVNWDHATWMVHLYR